MHGNERLPTDFRRLTPARPPRPDGSVDVRALWAAIAPGASRPAGAVTPAALLHLQRSAGNAAVARLVSVQRQTAEDAPPPVPICAGGTIDVEPVPVEADESGEAPVVARDEKPKPGAGSGSGSGAPPTPAVACPVPADFSVFKAKPGGDGSGRAAATAVSLGGFKNGTIKVTFTASKSWVDTNAVAKGGKRTPATTKAIAACKASFAKGNTIFSFFGQTSCPGAPSRTRDAESARQCDTVIGAGLDRDGAADETRLLVHEQYHVKLVCAAASKALATLPAGTTKLTKQVKAVYETLGQAVQPNSDQYDVDTSNGCDAAAQQKAQADIDAGNVKIAP